MEKESSVAQEEENPLAPEVEQVGVPSDAKPEDPVMSNLDPRLTSAPGARGEFVFPGVDGLPYRGATPNLKEGDRVRPQTASQVFVRVLNLADKDDLAKYEQISQMVGNGYAQISCEERMYDPDIKNWRVLIRWMLLYTHMPSESSSLFM